MTKPPHVIADLSFAEDWLECACGLMTTPDAYPQHRASMGLRTASFYQWLTDGTKFMKSTAPEECPKGHVGRMRIHDGRWRCNDCANEWARDARAKRREQRVAA